MVLLTLSQQGDDTPWLLPRSLCEHERNRRFSKREREEPSRAAGALASGAGAEARVRGGPEDLVRREPCRDADRQRREPALSRRRALLHSQRSPLHRPHLARARGQRPELLRSGRTARVRPRAVRLRLPHALPRAGLRRRHDHSRPATNASRTTSSSRFRRTSFGSPLRWRSSTSPRSSPKATLTGIDELPIHAHPELRRLLEWHSTSEELEHKAVVRSTS